MKEPGARPFIQIVAAIPEQQPVMANLLELYAHDFSGFYDVVLGPDGRFGYANLPLYWTDPDRHPFLIRVDRKLAGFALVKKGSEVTGNQNVWDLVEFFIARGFRRRASVLPSRMNCGGGIRARGKCVCSRRTLQPSPSGAALSRCFLERQFSPLVWRKTAIVGLLFFLD